MRIENEIKTQYYVTGMRYKNLNFPFPFPTSKVSSCTFFGENKWKISRKFPIWENSPLNMLHQIPLYKYFLLYDLH